MNVIKKILSRNIIGYFYKLYINAYVCIDILLKKYIYVHNIIIIQKNVKAKAYKIIRNLNEELEKRVYIVEASKVSN